MQAYDKYISGEISDTSLSDEDLARFISSADALNS